MSQQDSNKNDSGRMPEEIKVFLEQMSPFQRKYCEMRATGLKQADAAEKAGSTAADRASLGRVGYNTEQLTGVKEYIMWLQSQRAKAAMVDELEVIHKLRRVVDEAMMAGKYADANKALELLGNSIGMFKTSGGTNAVAPKDAKATKNNVNAFKSDDEGDDESDMTKAKKATIQAMLRDLNKS